MNVAINGIVVADSSIGTDVSFLLVLVCCLFSSKCSLFCRRLFRRRRRRNSRRFAEREDEGCGQWYCCRRQQYRHWTQLTIVGINNKNTSSTTVI